MSRISCTLVSPAAHASGSGLDRGDGLVDGEVGTARQSGSMARSRRMPVSSPAASRSTPPPRVGAAASIPARASAAELAQTVCMSLLLSSDRVAPAHGVEQTPCVVRSRRPAVRIEAAAHIQVPESHSPRGPAPAGDLVGLRVERTSR